MPRRSVSSWSRRAWCSPCSRRRAPAGFQPTPDLVTPATYENFSVASSTTTLADAVTGLATLDAHAESRRQAAVAERLVITKTDVREAQAAALRARLARINPGARQLEAVDLCAEVGVGDQQFGFELGSELHGRLRTVGRLDDHAEVGGMGRWPDGPSGRGMGRAPGRGCNLIFRLSPLVPALLR